MNREHWEIYAIIRKTSGKEAAENYRHAVRKKHRKYKIEEIENPWKVVFSDDDSVTKKRFFPWNFDDEEWEEYIDCEWINIYSPYDCTGKWFTVDLTKYETKTGTWIYHRLSIDI